MKKLPPLLPFFECPPRAALIGNRDERIFLQIGVCATICQTRFWISHSPSGQEQKNATSARQLAARQLYVASEAHFSDAREHASLPSRSPQSDSDVARQPPNRSPRGRSPSAYRFRQRFCCGCGTVVDGMHGMASRVWRRAQEAVNALALSTSSPLESVTAAANEYAATLRIVLSVAAKVSALHDSSDGMSLWTPLPGPNAIFCCSPAGALIQLPRSHTRTTTAPQRTQPAFASCGRYWGVSCRRPAPPERQARLLILIRH